LALYVLATAVHGLVFTYLRAFVIYGKINVLWMVLAALLWPAVDVWVLATFVLSRLGVK
jgi:hypothetical protein